MNCDSAREEFSALLDGELTPDVREDLEAHLAECSECLRRLEGYRRVSSLYAGLERIAAPDELESGVRRNLAPVALRSSLRMQRRWVLTYVAAAAALLIMLGGAWHLNRTDQPRFQMANEMALERAPEHMAAAPADAPAPTARSMQIQESSENSAVNDSLGYFGETDSESPDRMKKGLDVNGENVSNESALGVEKSRAEDEGGFGGGGGAFGVDGQNVAGSINRGGSAGAGVVAPGTSAGIETFADRAQSAPAKPSAGFRSIGQQAAEESPAAAAEEAAPEVDAQVTPNRRELAYEPDLKLNAKAKAESKSDNGILENRPELERITAEGERLDLSRGRDEYNMPMAAPPAPASPVPASEAPPMPTPEPAPATEPQLSTVPAPAEVLQSADELPRLAPRGSGEMAVVTAARTLRYRDGVWVQSEYREESLTTLKRDSEAWERLMKRDPSLVDFAALEAPVIFRAFETWYRLEAPKPAD